MRNLALLLVAFSIAISGCKRADKEVPKPKLSNQEKILGAWKLQEILYEDYENDVKVNEAYDSDVIDMTFTETHYTIVQGYTDTISRGTWDVTSDSLYLFNESEYLLKSLTETEMEIMEQSPEIITDSVVYRTDITVRFEKK